MIEKKKRKKIKPSFYTRYVDDIFVVFESPESSHSFRKYMSSKHQNIKQENIGTLLFLDVKICIKNNKFVTSVYRKPTFSGVFTNYENFIRTYQKRVFLHTLFHGSFSICSDFKTFHLEIDHLKTILMKNNYLPNFIDLCIKSFFNKLYTPKVIAQNTPKRNVFVKLSSLGKYFVSNSKEASKII